MSLISQEIPNLINGVSQQEARLRLPTQCEEQINCENSIVLGMGKRPNSVHLAEVPSFPTEAFFSDEIERDTQESYKVVITDGAIKVFDKKTGVSYPIVMTADASYLSANSQESLQAQFQILTTADTTFVLNKNRAVEIK